jgi:hypothetical protein
MYSIDKMLCIRNKDQFSLKGDFYSEEFKYLEIKLFKCKNNTSKMNCKNQTDIDKFFDPLYFSFAFINQYFDFSDY